MRTCKRGHQTEKVSCEVCRREYYQAHKEQERESNRQWFERNRKRREKWQQEYKKNNPGKSKEQWQAFSESHPLFSVWRAMILRCNNRKAQNYERYGGRGIKVCPQWLGENGYEKFLSDVPPRPTDDHQIDRINNNGNYEPGNIKWSTRAEQQRNRRNNVWVTIAGRTQCLKDWSLESGIAYKTLEKRLKNNWPESRFLDPPDPRFQTFGNTQRIHAA